MLDIAQKQRNLALKANIVPLSESGEDILRNLVTVCRDCHRNYDWEEIRRLVEIRVLANGHARFGAEEGRNTLAL